MPLSQQLRLFQSMRVARTLTFGTAIANVAMASAAGRFGAARASSTTFLIPVVALLLGVLIRGEHVALISIIGCLVCLTGAWLMKRASSH
jgi:drug/metabolite transporter (DMT)-like permease